jgi:hypothetical protein
MKVEDFSAVKFGRLTVIEQAGKIWLCRCDCGQLRFVASNSLKTGNTKSCGCFQKDQAAAFCRIRTKHGQTHTKEYKIWGSMKSRCYNSKSDSFDHYGKRGIQVCEKWLNSFDEFFRDMGKCPKGFQIDRIDNDKDYFPENCRWVDAKTNMRNRSITIRLTVNGITRTLYEWSEIVGIDYGLLWQRLRHGWTHEKIVYFPKRKHVRNAFQ